MDNLYAEHMGWPWNRKMEVIDRIIKGREKMDRYQNNAGSTEFLGDWRKPGKRWWEAHQEHGEK